VSTGAGAGAASVASFVSAFAEKLDASRSDHSLGVVGSGRFADMALQCAMGLLPEQRPGPDTSHHPIAGGISARVIRKFQGGNCTALFALMREAACRERRAARNEADIP
jgi:hypothetical protein